MTTIKFLLNSLTLILISGFKQAQAQYVVFYNPNNNLLETNLYDKSLKIKFDYQTQCNNLKSADVTQDVERAILHKDYRVVSISGYSYLYPGLDGGYQKLKDGTKMFVGLDKKYEGLVKKNGFRVIKGTSDVIRADAPSLQSAAYEYAKNYNTILLNSLN